MFEVVRTRFAPSPTGYLHIGGARTALYNYLLAKRLGGKFILRIEDTDQTRNIAGAEHKLVADLRWLGLHWDEGPETGGPAGEYHQSRRLDAYRGATRRLLDEGKAYYAFDTSAELDAMRAAAQKAKRNFRYTRPASFPSDAQADQARRDGRPVVVRLKMPEHPYVIRDQILGDVTLAATEVDDFVLVKNDGWPTYHFAVVVDDQDMQVTHVLRGQEHLMNTAKHMGLQESLGYREPIYAHLPLILNMDGSKMSKREKDNAVRAAVDAAVAAGRHNQSSLLKIAGMTDEAHFAAWRTGDMQLEGTALQRLARALSVNVPEIEIHDFRVSGYLPEVLLNFVALVGWSPGDDREKMTLDEMCTLFDVERVNKTNARFDRAKLLNFNTVALAEASPERRLRGLQDYLSVNEGSAIGGLDNQTLARLLSICEGMRVFRDVEVKCAALFQADESIAFDDDAVKKVLLKSDGEGLRVLRELAPVLAEHDEWSPAALDALLRGFAEQHKLGLGKVAQPLRVAVCGTTISPPIFDTLSILGKERTLRRLARAQERAAGNDSWNG